MLEWVAISFSRGVFPAQGLNPWLLPRLRHCGWFLYPLSHQGGLKSPVCAQSKCVCPGACALGKRLRRGEFYCVYADSCTLTSHAHTHTVTCSF